MYINIVLLIFRLIIQLQLLQLMRSAELYYYYAYQLLMQHDYYRFLQSRWFKYNIIYYILYNSALYATFGYCGRFGYTIKNDNNDISSTKVRLNVTLQCARLSDIILTVSKEVANMSLSIFKKYITRIGFAMNTMLQLYW